MQPRDFREPHRSATPLELFFDLVFVVAVSLASANMAHLLEESHIAGAVVSYAMIFWRSGGPG
ncbi:low temperature requirement protein A [Rhodococcus sp. 1R11]|uniref:low temperature requirement protein A n=1 Tax=Rhodococcus sp. 1R11 TaxID=2559614 RepID=UPI001FD720AE|nr:low temperature requirement protein A [Rhodococcus sp. 1R11]